MAIENSIPTEAGKKNFLKQSANLTKAVDPELVDLDSQIITCSPNVNTLLSSSPSFGGSCIAPEGTLASVKGMYLGGQCCSALMDTKEYHEHLEKLQAYKNMPDIILDPMHTPIELAKNGLITTTIRHLLLMSRKFMTKHTQCRRKNPVAVNAGITS